MDSALRFGVRDALDAVGSGLILQIRKTLGPEKTMIYSLNPPLSEGAQERVSYLQPFCISITFVHPDAVADKERGLIPACAGADFHDDIAAVEGIRRNKKIF